MRDAVTTSAGDAGGTGEARSALRIACAVLALACVPALTRIVLTVPLRLSLNYNEGWNAYHALDCSRAVPRSTGMTADSSSTTTRRCPSSSSPRLRASFGDPIVAGRWLSLGSFVAWTLVLARGGVRVRLPAPRRVVRRAALCRHHAAVHGLRRHRRSAAARPRDRPAGAAGDAARVRERRSRLWTGAVAVDRQPSSSKAT